MIKLTRYQKLFLIWSLLALSLAVLFMLPKKQPEQEKGYIEELSDTELEQIELGTNNDTLWDY
jgi:hypothetical protein